MIQAKHQWWAELLFRAYVIRSMKKHFFAIHLQGEKPHLRQDRPVILLPNHNTWWDGFFAYLITSKLFRRPIFLMMTEEQLRNYPFFSRVGAYSINLRNKKRMIQSLEYTNNLLEAGDEKAVCIFPEGELKPYSGTSIEYKRGIQWIMERLQSRVNIVQAAIRVEFLEQQRPEVFIKLSQTIDAGPESYPGLDALEQGHRDLLSAVEFKTEGDVLLSGKSSVHELYSKIADAVVGKRT